MIMIILCNIQYLIEECRVSGFKLTNKFSVTFVYNQIYSIDTFAIHAAIHKIPLTKAAFSAFISSILAVLKGASFKFCLYFYPSKSLLK